MPSKSRASRSAAASSEAIDAAASIPDRAARLLHPTRGRMVRLLAEPASATGLARQLGMPRQLVNYHLRELERARFVELVEERRKGNCAERFYRTTARAYLIDPDLLRSLGETTDARRDQFSSAFFVAAAAEAVRHVASARAKADAQGKRVSTLTLQGEVRFRTAADRQAFGEALTTALAGLVAQFHDEHAPDGRSFRLLVGCYPAAAATRQNAQDNAAPPTADDSSVPDEEGS